MIIYLQTIFATYRTLISTSQQS